MKINWSVFMTPENYVALLQFRVGTLSVKRLLTQVTTDEARREVRKMKYMPVNSMRSRARKAMSRMNLTSTLQDAVDKVIVQVMKDKETI